MCLICPDVCLQVLELTKEWTNKWNETQNILKVRRVPHVLHLEGVFV